MAVCCCTECKNVFITKNESENVAVCPKCGKSADILSEGKIKERRDEIYLSALHKKQIALYPRDLHEAKELFLALGDYRDCAAQIESCDYLADRLEARERAEDESRTFSPKKIKKALKITLAAVLSLSLIVTAAVILISPVKYAIAKNNHEKGNYDKAAELFAEIVDFSDSRGFLEDIYAYFSAEEGRKISCSALEPWFDVNAAGAITFIRSNYSGDGNIAIPSVFDGIEVDSIARNAFKNYIGLETVSIPDSVTSINDYAFYGCKKLKNITLPDSVESIAHYAFKDCESLLSINIPDGVTVINANTFEGCSLLAFPELPEGLTRIGTSAFAKCSSFEEIVLPMNVTALGTSAFSGCSSVKTVTFSVRMSEIKKDAFEGCDVLENVIYMGTAEEYKRITIEKGNEAFVEADVEYAVK